MASPDISSRCSAGGQKLVLTDAGQMVMVAILLSIVLIVVLPPLAADGIPEVPRAVGLAGATFAGLAAVQVLSYPFHDPVLIDRGFLTDPKTMVKGFLLAGLLSGVFILLFSTGRIYALAFGLEGAAPVAVPAALGLPMLLVFNTIMLTSAGSTLDSTFSSKANLAAIDWRA